MIPYVFEVRGIALDSNGIRRLKIECSHVVLISRDAHEEKGDHKGGKDREYGAARPGHPAREHLRWRTFSRGILFHAVSLKLSLPTILSRRSTLEERVKRPGSGAWERGRLRGVVQFRGLLRLARAPSAIQSDDQEGCEYSQGSPPTRKNSSVGVTPSVFCPAINSRDPRRVAVGPMERPISSGLRFAHSFDSGSCPCLRVMPDSVEFPSAPL